MHNKKNYFNIALCKRLALDWNSTQTPKAFGADSTDFHRFLIYKKNSLSEVGVLSVTLCRILSRTRVYTIPSRLFF